MRSEPRNRRYPSAASRLAALAPVLLLGSCASMQPEPEQQQEVESGVLELKVAVKTALLDAGGIAATPVRVEVEGNTIQLRGFVSTEQERRRAEEAALQAVPEAQIRNELRVWAPRERAVAESGNRAQ